jgi:hypothetical protein
MDRCNRKGANSTCQSVETSAITVLAVMAGVDAGDAGAPNITMIDSYGARFRSSAAPLRTFTAPVTGFKSCACLFAPSRKRARVLTLLLVVLATK